MMSFHLSNLQGSFAFIRKVLIANKWICEELSSSYLSSSAAAAGKHLRSVSTSVPKVGPNQVTKATAVAHAQ